MADVELVIKIPEGLKKDFESEQWTALSCMEMKNALEKATPLPKGHGDLIDRSKLEVCSIDITDLPTDKGLMVYYAEDVDKAPAIIEADNESEAANL